MARRPCYPCQHGLSWAYYRSARLGGHNAHGQTEKGSRVEGPLCRSERRAAALRQRRKRLTDHFFLHGFPEFCYEWKNQLAAFGQDHLAVAPDMRGYNLSTKPAQVDQYQVNYLIEDVRALAVHLGHKKFTLVAHDWGGAVAWAFANAHPECLEKLVIVNAPHPAVFARLLGEDPKQQQASQYMLLFRSPQAEATLAAKRPISKRGRSPAPSRVD